jgi:hypothetical protein
MKVVIADDPQRTNLYAELWTEGQPWAEVIYDPQKEAYLFTVFTGEQSEWVTLDLAEVLRGLSDAKRALVNRGYPDIGRE